MQIDRDLTHIRPAARDTRFKTYRSEVLAAIVVLALGVLLIGSGPTRSPDFTSTQIGYFAILIALTGLILMPLLGPKWGLVQFDLRRPLSFYGLFYLLYYLLPGFLLPFAPSAPDHNLLYIASLMCLGYAAFWAGLSLSGLKKPPAGRVSVSKTEVSGLFLLCGIAIILLVFYNIWRLSMGQFYTHAAYYEQATTILASFMDVFVGEFQLTLILLLGLLTSATSTENKGRYVRHFLYVYSSVIFAVFILTSQFRMSVTALVFLLAAEKLSTLVLVRLRHIALIGVLGLLALTVVQGFRNAVEPNEIADSTDQLRFSLLHLLPSFSAALTNWQAGVEAPSIARAVGQETFLSEIIDATERGVPHPYGADVLNAMYSVVPRFIWPNKPEVVPFQLTIRQRFGLQVHDDAPGPLVEFFAEGGCWGVFVGFLSFGYFLGALTRRTLSAGSIGMWIILVWVWSTAAQVEVELVVGLATTLRNAFAVYLLYRILVEGSRWFSFGNPPPRLHKTLELHGPAPTRT